MLYPKQNDGFLPLIKDGLLKVVKESRIGGKVLGVMTTFIA
jgi:hypothetical protein